MSKKEEIYFKVEPSWIKNDNIRHRVAIIYAYRLIPTLIQEYLNRKLDINKNFIWPKQNIELLQKYISDGIWDDKNIEKDEIKNELVFK